MVEFKGIVKKTKCRTKKVESFGIVGTFSLGTFLTLKVGLVPMETTGVTGGLVLVFKLGVPLRSKAGKLKYPLRIPLEINKRTLV